MTLTLSDQLWQTSEADFPADRGTGEKLAFLLRYAALAPSSHNSQPWEFSPDGYVVQIRPAANRWLKQADPDKRELYLSLGCALENLLVAAAHFGLAADWQAVDSGDGVTTVRVEMRDGEPSGTRAGLFPSIVERRTYHKPFAPLPLNQNHKAVLRDLIVDDSVHLVFLEGATGPKKEFGKLVVQADKEQFASREYRDELAEWFGAGIFGDGAVRSLVGKLAIRHGNIGRKQAAEDQSLVTNAPAIALLATDEIDHQSQIRCGRTYERMALAGVPIGLGMQPLSSPLQIEDHREELQSLLPSQSMHVQHVFRLGYPAEQEEHTPRLPMEEVVR